MIDYYIFRFIFRHNFRRNFKNTQCLYCNFDENIKYYEDQWKEVHWICSSFYSNTVQYTQIKTFRY